MRSGGARADAPGRQQLRRGADPGRRAGARACAYLPPTLPNERGRGLRPYPLGYLPTYLPTYAGRQSSRIKRGLRRQLNTPLKPPFDKAGLLSEQAREAIKAGGGMRAAGGGASEKQTPEGGEDLRKQHGIMSQGVDGGDTVSPCARPVANPITPAHNDAGSGAANPAELARVNMAEMLLPARADNAARRDLTNPTGDGGKAAHLLPPSMRTHAPPIGRFRVCLSASVKRSAFSASAHPS